MSYHVTVVGQDPTFFEEVQKALSPRFSCSFTSWGVSLSSLRSEVVLSDVDSAEGRLDSYESAPEQRPTRAIWLVASSDFCENHRIRAFEAGADDFIQKPCSARELNARIEARLKRLPNSETKDEKPVVLGGLTLNPLSYEITINGAQVRLSVLEFEILKLFATHPKVVFSRLDLLTRVWKNTKVHSRTIDTHIALMRKKLPHFDYEINTIYGAGYCMAPV